MVLPPLLMEPEYKETVWGGTGLRDRLGKRIPEGMRVGESWEIADHPNGRSRVVSAPFAGRPFGEVFREHAGEILGPRLAEAHGGRFPLLVKFIDPADRLSVQVHPDDAYAALHEAGSAGKTEAWYVVEAEPGAELVAGFSRPTSRQEFERFLAEGRLEELLRRVPVRKGDVLFVPAGRVHAILPGVLLNEVQQNSDITYRVYDWGRVGRELHLAKALEVMDYGDVSAAVAVPQAVAEGVELLVQCGFFTMERLTVDGGREFGTEDGSFHAFSVVEGAGRLLWEGGGFEVRKGDSLVVPWSCGRYRLEGRMVAVRTRM